MKIQTQVWKASYRSNKSSVRLMCSVLQSFNSEMNTVCLPTARKWENMNSTLLVYIRISGNWLKITYFSRVFLYKDINLLHEKSSTLEIFLLKMCFPSCSNKSAWKSHKKQSMMDHNCRRRCAKSKVAAKDFSAWTSTPFTSVSLMFASLMGFDLNLEGSCLACI